MSRHNKIANWTKSAQLGNLERNIDHQIKILCQGDINPKKNKEKGNFFSEICQDY